MAAEEGEGAWGDLRDVSGDKQTQCHEELYGRTEEEGNMWMTV